MFPKTSFLHLSRHVPCTQPRAAIHTIAVGLTVLLAGCGAPLGLSDAGAIPVTAYTATALATATDTQPALTNTSALQATLEPTIAATASALNSGATPTALPSPDLAAIASDTPPRMGSFDVYLDGPDESGFQRLRWIDTGTGETVTQITVRADDERSEERRVGKEC